MKIFIDMDHTLNKLYESYNEQYLKMFNRDLGLTREGLTTYFIHEITGPNSTLERERKYQIFNTLGFWENIPIYDNAAQVMEQLYKKHDVYIVTAPWVEAPNCYLEKANWVKKNLPFFDVNKIIYTKFKHLLLGDVIVDDNPEYLVNNMCRWQIKMWYPFNEKINALDAANWLDIQAYISELNRLGKKYGRLS